MLSNIFSTASLLVVAWLAVQMSLLQRNLNDVQISVNSALGTVQQSIASSNQSNAGTQDDVLARMDKLLEQGAQSNGELDRVKKALVAKDKELGKMEWRGRELDKKIEADSHIAHLQTTLTDVFEAQLLAVDKNGVEAAEKLLSTKSAIWKLSSKWPESKDTLRGLMAPIDILAGKWKRDDFTSSSLTIRKIIAETLAKQKTAGAS